jgi:hypothetical protein
MSKKRGRPKKDIARRVKFIGFNVTHDQYSLIQRKAEQAMVNISDYMRQVAIAGEVRARWTAEERGMVKELIGMSAEVHRLAGSSSPPGVSSGIGASGLAGVGVSGTSEAPGGCASGASGVGVEVFKQFGDELDIIIKHLCHDR